MDSKYNNNYGTPYTVISNSSTTPSTNYTTMTDSVKSLLSPGKINRSPGKPPQNPYSVSSNIINPSSNVIRSTTSSFSPSLDYSNSSFGIVRQEHSSLSPPRITVRTPQTAQDILIKSLLQIRDALSSSTLDFPTFSTDQGNVSKQEVIQGINNRIQRIRGVYIYNIIYMQ